MQRKYALIWAVYRKVYPIYHFRYTICGKTIIQFVAFLLYHLWICQLWKCILSYRKRNWSNFIAFGLHCLGVVRERKKRYRNLAADFLYRLYSMFWTMLDSCFEQLIFVLVEEGRGMLGFKWLYYCVSLFDHFIMSPSILMYALITSDLCQARHFSELIWCEYTM